MSDPVGTVGAGRRVVVASADVGTREHLGNWLGGSGRTVTTLSDPARAVLVVARGEADLAFVDLEAQEAAGLRAVELMCQARPRVPVVVVANDLGLRDLRRARTAGVFFTMIKPIDRAEVEDIATSAFRRATA